MSVSMFGPTALIAALVALSGLATAAQPLTGATAIAIGVEHACATLQGGGAACWGTTQTPVGIDVLNRPSSGRAAGPVGDLSAALTRISVGHGHACALSAAGEVLCWGNDIAGQLGNGAGLTAPSGPGRVAGLVNATSVAAAGWHSCAVASGAAYCWGSNSQGQLGNGAASNSDVPVAVSGLGGVQQVAAGGLSFDSFSCAIAGGAAYCWGSNGQGQLGDGTAVGKLTPAAVVGLGSGMTAIAAGVAHACAVQSGVVKCWGDNTLGQLGDGTLADRLAPVTVVNVGAAATAVAAGRYHSCALRNDGIVVCWGANAVGQLGDGTSEQRTIAAPVIGLGSIAIAIAAGMDTTCALLANGEVRCFGDNSNNLLGLNFQASHFVPIGVVAVPAGFAGIEAGDAHTCAVDVAGGAWCFGAGAEGQLGTGLRRDEAMPAQVASLGSGVAEVTSGATHSCARSVAGAALCWGGGASGQLGHGSTAEALTPVAVTGLTSGVASISAGWRFTCASTTAGGVKCWGENGDGNLGNGTTQSSTTPVDIPGLAGVQRATAGGSHACALRNGGVKCWGANQQAQLGDGTFVSRSSPVDVLGLTAGVATVHAGRRHTCAVAGSSVRCWGDNSRGQLGDGTTLHRPYAVTVAGLPAASVGVAAGDGHSCALLADGTVWCWGEYQSGQIGPNWNPAMGLVASKPVLVPLNQPAVGVTAGALHTCAIFGGGGASCWGSAASSQLGNGEAQRSAAPRVVLVGDFSTTTTVTTTPSPSVEPEYVTITARVSASETVPAGLVAFYDGNEPLNCVFFPGGVALLGGAATCTQPLLSGLHTLRAEYLGDSANLPSSGTTTHQVQVSPGQHCAGFDDVDAADPMCRSIAWLRNRGITQGCSAYAFCPGQAVSRLVMAAFMDRLGGAMTPEVVSGTVLGGPHSVGSFSSSCLTPSFPPASYPRLAMVDAALSLANVNGDAELRLVMRFGFQSEELGSPVRITLPASNTHVTARLAGTFLVAAGAQPTFAVQGRGLAGLQTVADFRCTLRAAIVSGEDTHAPFDASTGGTP